MKDIGIHIQGTGARAKRYIIYRANDGILHLYRTYFDKKDDVHMERIVTNCTEVEQIRSFLRKKRKRRKKTEVKQLTIY